MYEIGDKVKLLESSMYAHQGVDIIGETMEGTVIRNDVPNTYGSDHHPYKVRWNDNTTNTYRETDITLFNDVHKVGMKGKTLLEFNFINSGEL